LEPGYFRPAFAIDSARAAADLANKSVRRRRSSSGNEIITRSRVAGQMFENLILRLREIGEPVDHH